MEITVIDLNNNWLIPICVWLLFDGYYLQVISKMEKNIIFRNVCIFLIGENIIFRNVYIHVF